MVSPMEMSLLLVQEEHPLTNMILDLVTKHQALFLDWLLVLIL